MLDASGQEFVFTCAVELVTTGENHYCVIERPVRIVHVVLKEELLSDNPE